MHGYVLGLVLLGDVEEVFLAESQNITVKLRETAYHNRQEGCDVLLRGVAVGEVGKAFAMAALPDSGSQIFANPGDERKKMCKSSALMPSSGKMPINALTLLLMSLSVNDML